MDNSSYIIIYIQGTILCQRTLKIQLQINFINILLKMQLF